VPPGRSSRRSRSLVRLLLKLAWMGTSRSQLAPMLLVTVPLVACGGGISLHSQSEAGLSEGDSGQLAETGGQAGADSGYDDGDSWKVEEAGKWVPACVPGRSLPCACVNGLSGAQVCTSAGTFGTCTCAEVPPDRRLGKMRDGLVGTWVGTQTNPWGEPCPTMLNFESSGHYSAHSPGDICPVFYYGPNDDSPRRRYELTGVQASGEGLGEIEIVDSSSETTRRHELRHVNLDGEERTLSFELWREGDGPLVFSLTRHPGIP
jgi:hypothetical protein